MSAVPQPAPARRPPVPAPARTRRGGSRPVMRPARERSGHVGRLRLVPTGPHTGATGTLKRNGKHRLSAVVLLAGGVILAGAVIFGLVLVNIFLAQSSFRLSDLQGRVAEQEARHRQLRLEVAKAEAPERIAQTAAELGLQAPGKQEYILGPAAIRAGRQAGDGVSLATEGAASPGSGSP